MRNKIIIASLLVLSLLLVGTVTSYSCIHEGDNEAVKDFKTKMNIAAIQNDFDRGVATEAIKLKIKYFSGCQG